MSKELIKYLENRCAELLLENEELKKNKLTSKYEITLEKKGNDLLIYSGNYYIGTYEIDCNYIKFFKTDYWKITPEELLEIVLMIEDKKDEIK